MPSPGGEHFNCVCGNPTLRRGAVASGAGWSEREGWQGSKGIKQGEAAQARGRSSRGESCYFFFLGLSSMASSSSTSCTSG